MNLTTHARVSGNLTLGYRKKAASRIRQPAASYPPMECAETHPGIGLVCLNKCGRGFHCAFAGTSKNQASFHSTELACAA